jgi:protein-S-isoprenylcysteine O-methyltransferase Ste14
MKARQANLLNATVLIIAGLYGYFGLLKPDGTHAVTALIPAIFGVVFLAMHKGLAAQNKIISHAIVIVTLFLLGICVGMFFKIEDWGAKKYLFLACIISNIVAIIAFIGSFIEARKNRQKLNG